MENIIKPVLVPMSSTFMWNLQTRHKKCPICGEKFYGPTKWYTKSRMDSHIRIKHGTNKTPVFPVAKINELEYRTVHSTSSQSPSK